MRTSPGTYYALTALNLSDYTNKFNPSTLPKEN